LGFVLFLSDDFYRVIAEDGKLKAVKIGYRNEDSLKSTLNLKSQGKISVVKNNTKTPFHWKTLKHTNISSALREIEHQLLGEPDYLLESAQPVDPNWIETWNTVLKQTLNSTFFGKEEAILLKIEIDGDPIESGKSSVAEHDDLFSSEEWELIIHARPRVKDEEEFLEEYSTDGSFEVVLNLKSDIDFYVEHEEGDWETPSYSHIDVVEIRTSINEVYLGGGQGESDPELLSLLSSIEQIIEDFDRPKLVRYLNDKTQDTQLFLPQIR